MDKKGWRTKKKRKGGYQDTIIATYVIILKKKDKKKEKLILDWMSYKSEKFLFLLLLSLSHDTFFLSFSFLHTNELLDGLTEEGGLREK